MGMGIVMQQHNAVIAFDSVIEQHTHAHACMHARAHTHTHLLFMNACFITYFSVGELHIDKELCFF